MRKNAVVTNASRGIGSAMKILTYAKRSTAYLLPLALSFGAGCSVGSEESPTMEAESPSDRLHGSAAATGPSAMRGNDRVLVMTSSDPSDPQFEAQIAPLREHAAALAERRVNLVTVMPELVGVNFFDGTYGQGHVNEASAWRAVVGVSGYEPFGVALVGLDGGVKLRSDKPIAIEALVATIDEMPMRRAELRAPAQD